VEFTKKIKKFSRHKPKQKMNAGTAAAAASQNFVCTDFKGHMANAHSGRHESGVFWQNLSMKMETKRVKSDHCGVRKKSHIEIALSKNADENRSLFMKTLKLEMAVRPP